MKHLSSTTANDLNKSRLVALDLSRDQCVVIRRTGNPQALKKSLVKMRRIMKNMPMVPNGDTVDDVRRYRSEL